MEDEGFVEDEFIAETARKYVALHGANAVVLLEERVRIAAVAGDFLLAQTCREILAAAEAMVRRLELE